MNDLLPLAETIAARLKARSETIAVAESSTGGLISAALLSVPGASAFFLGGAIVYTRQAKSLLLAIGDGALSEFRPAHNGARLASRGRAVNGSALVASSGGNYGTCREEICKPNLS